MKPLKDWEKNHCGSDDPAFIKRSFAKRHAIALFLIFMGAIGNFVLTYLCLRIFNISKADYEGNGFALFNALAIASGVFYCLFQYRCPRCNKIPQSIEAGGILLFPRKCHYCEAPLMPDSRWAQD